MSQKQKQVVTDLEWLAAALIAAVGFPVLFVFFWHAFDSWPQALATTSISAWAAQNEWERRYAAPDRNVQLRGRSRRR